MSPEDRSPDREAAAEERESLDPEPLDPEPLAADLEDVVRVFDPERWRRGTPPDDEPPYIRADAPSPPG